MTTRRTAAAVAQTLLPILLLLGLAAAFIGIDTQDMDTVPASTSDALVQAHDCWTGQGPEGVIPGHVVVTHEGEAAAVYAGPKVAGQALDQIFNNEAHGLTIHAFCR